MDGRSMQANLVNLRRATANARLLPMAGGDAPHGSALSLPQALELVGLSRLWRRSRGRPSLMVGLIDGAIDSLHPALAATPVRRMSADSPACAIDAAGEGLSHGTAIAGVLFGDRRQGVPGLCPDCSFVHYRIFCDSHDGTAADVTPAVLARAIIETVDAGARLINLSLGVESSAIQSYPELDEACDYACQRGALLVCAAGNQGRLGHVALASHVWTIPVVACDDQGRFLGLSNLSPSIGARGLTAPGAAVLTTIPGARLGRVSGTSVATAFISGALALLWSAVPDLSASDLKRLALDGAGRFRRGLIPPRLDAESVLRLCQARSKPKEIPMIADSVQAKSTSTSADVSMLGAGIAPASFQTARTNLDPGRLRGARAPVVAQDASCPSCAAEAGAAGSNEPPTYIYAIGTIKMRFPTPGVEKEFAQAAAGAGTANLSDQQVVYRTLKENRYLANEVCWVFSIENVEAYVLVPRDTHTLELFIAATAPSSKGIDVDVIIGQRGPMAPAEMCNGLIAPIVLVDQLYSFNKPDLVSAIARPKESAMTDKAFRGASEELFDRIQQLADNVGASDEHRALNYLSVRYQQLFAHTASMYTRDFGLTSVEVMPSRLAGARRLVNVLLTYTNRNTDVTEKYYIRVDVSEKYPFLDKKLSTYYDR
jgi:Subtilase family/PatG C-terminal